MDARTDALTPEPPRLSRREGPRLEVEAVLNGRLIRGNLRLNLLDLGFGGFAVESPLAFAPGTRHRFRFVTCSGMVVNLRADAVYCRAIGSEDGMAHHAAGFKYVIEGRGDQASVDILIDAANSPLTIL
jgi:hypothetical protein